MFQSDSPTMGLRFDSQREIIREKILEFKNNGDEQCRKINAMSITEVFEFMKKISTDSLDMCGVWFCLCVFYPATELTDANVIIDTIKAILMCIQSRLEGTTDIDHIVCKIICFIV